MIARSGGPANDGAKIAVLPDDLANQIAAGEVVERPASVAKELAENSIDARATKVRIDVERGGSELVRVADDGEGMSRDDASRAILRHATSKIRTLVDLHAIGSFGFRGEALPSIASVSKFVLRTRRRADDEGTEVRVDGGGAAIVAPCGVAPGTIVEVRDLFYNVPARRKFLKSEATESANITEVAQSLALAEFGVTVTLGRNGRVVREWLRAPDREERARDVLAGEDLAACRGERGPLAVEAFLSRPERARNGAGALSIFVNKRHIRDRALARAVALAYGSVLEPGRYPVGVVYLDLPPELVDVNVHPQKAEVRFADGRAVADALFRLISGGVASAFGLPTPAGYPTRYKQQSTIDEPPPPSGAAWMWSGVPSPAADSLRALTVGPTDPWGLAAVEAAPIPEGEETLPLRDDKRKAPLPDGTLPPESTPPAPVVYPNAAEVLASGPRPVVFGALRFLAQSRNTFLVCEGNDGIYFLDQHAAAERVTFHRLRTSFDARDVAMQKLLFPTIVDVSAAEAAMVEEAEHAFLHAGLEVRVAGPQKVAVHAVPRLLARAAPERLLRDLLGEMGAAAASGSPIDGVRAYSGAIDLAIATMACHGSLRAGDPVAPEEARALLQALDEVDFAGHCPHGRPVVMRVSWAELETRVGRR